MVKTGTSWWKAGSYSLLGYAAQLGFAFVMFLLLVRWLTDYDFGVWVLYMTLVSFAEMGRMGLLQNAVIKFGVEDQDRYGTILTTGLVLNTVCTVVLSAVLLVLSWPLSHWWSAPELPKLILWYPLWAIIHGTARYIDFAHMMHHDFRGVFISKLLYGATFLTLIIAVWWSSGQIELYWLVIMQATAGVPSLLIYSWYRRDYLRWGRYSALWGRRIFHFGKYVLGTNISSMLFNKMDLMMVGFFLHPTAVAIYNVATRITNYLEVPMSGIAQVIYPRLAMANQEAGTQELTQLYEKAVGLIVALVLPMVAVVLLFAEPVVVLIAGQQYASAAPLLTILVLAVMIKPWGRLFGITLDAIGKPQLNFMLLLMGLAVNIGLNALFLYWWGLRGAAFATLLAMTLMVVTGQVLITRFLPIRQSNILRQLWSFYRQPRQVLQLK